MLSRKQLVDALVTTLRSLLPVGWSVECRLGFLGIEPDVLVVHPELGVTVFRVAVVADYGVEESWSAASGGQDDFAADDVRWWSGDADPREELLYWRRRLNDVLGLEPERRTLLRAVLLIVSGNELGKEFDPMNGFKGRQLIMSHCVVVDSNDQLGRVLDEVARATVRFNEVATLTLGEDEWRRLQVEVLGTEDAVVGLAPERTVQFSVEQHRVLEHLRAPGLKRVRGPAGAGKTLIVAKIVAECVQSGGRALVLVRNKTMVNLIRTRVLFFLNEGSVDRETRRRNTRQLNAGAFITWQENWWENVCCATGSDHERRRIYRTGGDQEVRVLALVREVLEKRTSKGSGLRNYDLVVVDEAQNVLPEMWSCVTKVVHDNGRAVVVSDPTQTMYGKRAWTDERMRGFQNNPWRELRRSHRLPPDFASVVSRMLVELPLEDASDVLVPEVEMQESLFPTRLLRVDPRGKERFSAVADSVEFAVNVLGYAPHQVAFVVPANRIGLQIASALLGRGLAVQHSFDENLRTQFALAMGIRGSTYHSFAGWESPCVVLDVGFLPMQEKTMNDLFYSGMTRLAHHGPGSTIVVVEASNDVGEFVRRNFQPVDESG